MKISNNKIEMVSSYKCLGLQLDDKLDWSVNTDYVDKKVQSRLYFLRRLASFNVCRRMLLMFSQSVGFQRPLLWVSVLGGQHQTEGHTGGCGHSPSPL